MLGLGLSIPEIVMWFLLSAGGGGGLPSNAYVAEDNTTGYVAEDGTTFYVQES